MDPPHHTSASGIREVAQQGGLLVASRLTLRDLHQEQRAKVGVNNFAQVRIHAQVARHHVPQPPQPHPGFDDERLGSGFREWALSFPEALEMAEMATRYIAERSSPW
ncbi:hypothetical protein CCR75_006139 [Bremia lactucae]|uniref:Uncharacterized protein n=1 Tax=Bremia lactucae TaxID=4779 RepID=A0A976FEX8_BRELC|nr:hypothetical protein CCR75_006139 [Bremia lactucae]